jgi:hypothetical protein
MSSKLSQVSLVAELIYQSGAENSSKPGSECVFIPGSVADAPYFHLCKQASRGDRAKYSEQRHTDR